MYLLRSISLYRGTSEFLTDAWYQFEDIEVMTDAILSADPDEYQCFEAVDLTDQVSVKVDSIKEKMSKRDRFKEYEKLKLEFENGK